MNKTGNASSEMQAVVNHPQQVSGIRIRDIPFVRRVSVVTMKLIEPRNDARQKIPMLMSHRSAPSACPGPAEATALSGGENVQPPIGAPPAANSALIKTMKLASVSQNESMLSRGKTISRAPSWIGKK